MLDGHGEGRASVCVIKVGQVGVEKVGMDEILSSATLELPHLTYPTVRFPFLRSQPTRCASLTRVGEWVRSSSVRAETRLWLPWDLLRGVALGSPMSVGPAAVSSHVMPASCFRWDNYNNTPFATRNMGEAWGSTSGLCLLVVS